MSTSPYFAKAFLGTNGRPAASGWFYAYAAWSTVPKAIYSDYSKTIPLSNPLRLDGNGICPQFFTEEGLYDFKVFEYNFVTPDEPGPSCFTAEDIDGESGGGGSTYVLPIATNEILGGIKPDDTSIFVDEETGEASVAETLTLANLKLKPKTTLTDIEFQSVAGVRQLVMRYDTLNNEVKVFTVDNNVPGATRLMIPWDTARSVEILRGLVVTGRTKLDTSLNGPIGATNGVIGNMPLPIATETVLGCVKPDGTTVQVDPLTGVLSVIPDEGEQKTVAVAVSSVDESQDVTLPSYTMTTLAQVDLPAGFFLTHSRLSLSVLVMTTTDPLPSGYVQFIGYLGVAGSEVSVFGTSSTGPNSVGTAPVLCEIYADASSGLVSSQVTATQDGASANSNSSQDQPFNLSQPLRFMLRAMHLSASPLSVSVSPHAFTTYETISSIVGAPGSSFQPLEDQRLSTDDSVTFATATARSVRVDTASPDTTPVIGSTFWDADAKTLATHVENGSILQHGQELVLYARNNSGTNILDGQCVYITGASGNKCTIALADSDNRTASHIIAVATQDIADNSDGYVTLAGRVNDIDTSAFAEGAEVWLGDVPGSLVSTLPSGANVRARVGYIIRSHATQGALEVSINRYPFFSELSGNGVTTRTTTSATSAPTRFVRYTGTGGHTEALPTATTISADRYYRNSGTGPWTIVANGTDTIDPGNPAALVSSVTLLPGQTLHIYVALTGLWEAF